MFQIPSHPRHWVDASGNPVNSEIVLVGETALAWLAALSEPNLGMQVYSYESQDYIITARNGSLTIYGRSDSHQRAILYAEANPTTEGEIISYQIEIAPEHVNRFRQVHQWLRQIKAQRNQWAGREEPD